MKKRPDVRTIDLKKYIKKISQIENVLEIYLFGSRAFKTGCLTSDIDILIYYENGIDNNELRNIRNAEHALDLFKTHDKCYAESFCNGSHITDENLIETLHAKLLWSKDKGNNEELLIDFGEIDVLRNIDFKMSNFCTYSESEEKFFKQYGHNVVFIIMPFAEEFDMIYNIVVETFKKKGIKAFRASEKEMKQNLWGNVKTYLDCCCAAVSIFHYDKDNEFNPNVALETGYIYALGKSVCLLKDNRQKYLPTDLLGQLFKSYDINNIQDIENELNNWIKDVLNK